MVTDTRASGTLPPYARCATSVAQALPDELAVSVVTIGELRAGVLAAAETEVRARRLATLTGVFLHPRSLRAGIGGVEPGRRGE